MLMTSALKVTEMTCVLFEEATEINSKRVPGKKQATATEDFDVHVSYLLS